MRYCYPILLLIILSCKRDPNPVYHSYADTTAFALSDTISRAMHPDSTLQVRVVAFAKTLLGTPYKFGCSAPATGFDCSGFITYVFNHFNIDVPRSSVGFTNEGITIVLENAQPGDLILFTGTDPSIKTVGHIGLIIANDTSGISFIHSSSGDVNAVIITQLNDAYRNRFVKVVRVIK